MLGIAEHRLQLRENGVEGGAGRALGGVAVAAAAGLEQAVGVVAQACGRFDVAAEEEHVALGAEALVGERALEPRPVRAAVAGVAERPEAAEIGVEVAAAVGVLHLGAAHDHVGERIIGAVLGPMAREKAFEPEPERLDLLELLDAERRDARAAARQADDEALALEAAERVADRGEADVEPGREILEPQPLLRREPEPPDLLPQRPVDGVLDRRKLE